jgi:hypothetical protein
MKNKLATLCCALLAAVGLHAQSTALQFDGHDDYVEAISYPYLSAFNQDGFTVEVIFRKTQDKPDQVLVAQQNRNGLFIIGLTDMGEPFTEVFGERYIAENMMLPNEECHQLSVVYSPDYIDFYVNGNVVYQALNNSGTNILVENEPFYFGQAYPDHATTFFGVIDDMRIFTDVRTAAEIAQFTLTELPLQVTNKYMYFNFNNSFGAYFPDPYYSMSKAWLGGIQQIHHQMPQTVEGMCAKPLPEPESVSSACQPMPACITTGLPPTQLLCNGDFEQYCSVLNGTQQPWVLPEHAFQDLPPFLTSTNPGSVPGSDVTNWEVGFFSTIQTISPDFFVRNGIGSPSGFEPTLPYSNPNWLAHPPTETYNGTGNAAAGLLSIDGINESIKTTLRQNLQSNTTYQFSGWFYNTGIAPTATYTPPPITGFVSVKYSDASGNNLNLAGTASVPYGTTVTNNNGWHFVTITFTTPTLAANINTFIIENTSTSAPGPGVYCLVDDASLTEVQPTAFPQHINTGEHNDSWHRRLKVDANDNVYIAGKVSNNSPALEFGLPVSTSYPLTTNRRGSFLAKYSSGGNLMWSRFIDNLLINDFEIMPNGNLFIVGETEALAPGTSTSTVINWVQTVPTTTLPICPGGTPVQVDHTNSPNLFVMQVNATTGQNIGTIDGFGGLGSESAKEVEIIGNTAYIAANVDTCTFNVQGVGQQCSFAQGGFLDWHPIQTAISENRILTYDLTSGTRNWFANTNANNTTTRLEMLGTHNADLVLLREDGIQSLNTGSPSNTPSAIVNLTADFMHVTDNGHIYLIMNGYTYMHHRLERRLTTSISTIDAVATYQYRDAGYNWLAHNSPLSVCSKGNDVYILGQYVDFTNGNNIFEHYVEKLDFAPSANFGDVIWSVQSAGTNTRYPAYMSAGDWVITEGAPFNTSSGLAVTANYTSDATSWQLSLPPKTLAANNGSLQSHTFVAKIADNGSNGQYNKKESDAVTGKNFTVYPNPASELVTIESVTPIKQIDLLTVNGQLLITQKVNDVDAFNLLLPELARGVYLLQVITVEGIEVQKLSIE